MESKATRLQTPKPRRPESIQTADPVLLQFYELLTREDREFLAACNISAGAEVEAY